MADSPASPGLHRNLRRQLRRLGLTGPTPPDADGWTSFLDQVSAAYQNAEDDRYMLERAIEVSSEEMRVLHEALFDQAHCDALTGLPNRAALRKHLGDALDRYRPKSGGPAVLFLDLDGFKLINDSLGHRAGDDLLVRVAERIRAAVRESDLVARLGGDEFVVVMDDVSELEPAIAAAQRIAAGLQLPFRLDGQDSVIGASIGIACATDGSTTVEDLLRQADLAMYEAKAGGRDRYVVFDDAIAQRAEGQLSLLNALRQAVEADHLELRYQPVVSLTDGRLTSLEALVRWNRPGCGLVGPEVFIAVAEESGLIPAVDAWVIQRACVETAAAGAGAATLTVKLSAHSLRHDDLVRTVGTVLEHTGRRAETLVLELTESAFALGNPTITDGLSRLRALGVRLAIDDFGTGYSSLNYLQHIPAQILKIDRSFVSRLDQDRSSVAIVGAIIQLGQAVGMHVVAEGVERAGQHDALVHLGCDAAQGRLFGHPQPLADILALHGSGRGNGQSCLVR
jgi:diguanylate cyclase (GGDEF)-like protein